ncbi:SLBB-domain like (DUF1017) [Grimontia hollisae]|uniref:SLBB-domain like (DUF1017) n=1 Tax=Grimontia hollisae TaxID=673 RepID=A0A377HM43_GRIHO|nr:SLBB-domain like (DUF1017) [Grimontia hollisae]
MIKKLCISRLSFPFFCRRSIVLFCFVLTPHAAIATEETAVTVTSSVDADKHLSLSFNNAPRISQLVSEGASVIRAHISETKAHSTDSIYWTGAGLFSDDEDTSLNALSSSVINKLNKLAELWYSDSKKRDGVLSLCDFIAASTFKPRLTVTLDEDVYLAGTQQNPLMKGRFYFQLPSRPTHIWITGAVAKTQKIPFSAPFFASDYLNNTTTLNTFGISNVSVIQPNGELETHHVSYWNHQPAGLAPGAIIFVPFQHLPTDLDVLNQEIPRLLQHRVM